MSFMLCILYSRSLTPYNNKNKRNPIINHMLTVQTTGFISLYLGILGL